MEFHHQLAMREECIQTLLCAQLPHCINQSFLGLMGWFESGLTHHDDGTTQESTEIDIWGYSESAGLYWRLDVYHSKSVRVTKIDYAAWWQAYGAGVVLVAPLEEEKIDGKTVLSRYGFFVASPDAMTVFSEHRDDNMHWTPYPPGNLKWPRMR